MSGFFHFLKAGLKNPLQLSTMFETGPKVGRRFAKHIEHKIGFYVVEFGVGAGAITLHLLPKLGFPPQYIGFELNKDLFKYLNETYPDLEIYNESAENLPKRLHGRKVSAVVSTLPWSLLTKETRTNIVKQAYEHLEPGGIFCTFLAMHVLWTPAARDFLNQIYEVFPEITYENEMLNVPPCRVYIAKKH